MEGDLHRAHAEHDSSHWWFVGRRKVIEQTVKRHLRPADERLVVDVGCGAGGLIPMLQTFGRVVALEMEPTAAAAARERHPEADIRVGTLPESVSALPTAPLITAFDVIEHLDDDVATLDALRDRLEPGGLLCVTVPALPWLWSSHDVRNQHRRRYTARSLRASLHAADYRVEHLSYFNTLLLPLVLVGRLLERVRPGREGASDFDRSLGPIDRVLEFIFAAERHVVPRARLPIGVSLIAIARPR